MVKIFAIVFALFFVPYLVISKAQQLKQERQAKIRYFIFIFIVVLLIVTLIKVL